MVFIPLPNCTKPPISYPLPTPKTSFHVQSVRKTTRARLP